jgi:hypothetical protein
VAPCAVTRASVGVVDPGGQFVPFWRQTFEPFTWIEEAKTLVPEAVTNEKIVDVAWDAVRNVVPSVVIDPEFAESEPAENVPIEPEFAKSWVVETVCET